MQYLILTEGLVAQRMLKFMVVEMEVDKVADMVVDMKVDKVANEMVDMEVDKVTYLTWTWRR